MKVLKMKSKTAAIFTASILTAFTVGSLAYFSYTLYSKNTELLKNMEGLKINLKNSKDEISELQKEKISGDAIIADLKNNLSQANAMSDDLNNKIGAFAKQAASCDRVKKRLHIKD